MTTKLASAVCALSLVLSGSAATLQSASAQAPTVPAPPLAGPPSPEQVQPWGVPPPPPGIGPVTLFADIHDQPQGKFLEGGAFDKAGNFWFVAIGSGWVSYLTPDAKLALVANSLDWVKDGDSWKGQPDNKLFVIDLSASPPAQIAAIEVGRQPSGIAINRAGNMALVANRADDTVSNCCRHLIFALGMELMYRASETDETGPYLHATAGTRRVRPD